MKKFLARRQTKIFLSWFLVFLCILSIFLIVPIARTIQNFVAQHWSRALFGYLVIVVVGVAFLVSLYILVFQQRIRSAANYIWLFLVMTLYLYTTLKLWENPVEAIHFLEYGLLGFLLYRALKIQTKDIGLYFIAFLIGCLVGILDEILQWIVPFRYWDIRDVGLNALASGLFQVGLWKGIRPKGIFPRIKLRSFRTVSIFLAVNIILFGLCLSNTPDRVSTYTKTFSALSDLEKQERMNRFKLKHVDPDIGKFHSLLSTEALKNKDRSGAVVYGKTLKEWKNRTYEDFTGFFTPFKFPFLYEFRTHVEIRNNDFQNAQDVEEEEKKKRYYLGAYKENLILEKYFGQTLRKASYRWKKNKINSIKSLIDPDAPYNSPIQFGLVFPWSEKILWISILGFLIAFAALNVFLFRSRKFT